MSLLTHTFNPSLTLDHHPVLSSIKTVQERLLGALYPFFQEINDPLHLHNIQKAAAPFMGAFKNYVILGTGGSSLGAKTLWALKDNKFSHAPPRFFFPDNVDPHTFDQLLHGLTLKETLFLIISKSGTTSETLCQLFSLHTKLNQHELPLQKQCLVITEERDTPLKRFAQDHAIPMLPHPQNIGGRFSVFSVVGMLPATLGGLDIKALHQGATTSLSDFLENPHTHPAALGASFAVTALAHGKPMSVMMPYRDALEPFAQWYCQLWAESLGKEGKGSTPIRALGTVDQHSQLQLYQEGPNDKIFTFLVEDTHGKGNPLTLPQDATLAYLKGQTMGDLLKAEAQATRDSLIQAGRSVRQISFTHLNEEVLGALLVHFMLETIITAEVLGIDAFNQPGVEQSKKLTQDYLLRKETP